MRQTIDAIVECSKQPMSIIIIGVGAADFKDMEILDADDVVLYNSKCEECERDIVQFVRYRDFNEDSGLLAQNVLKEIPE